MKVQVSHRLDEELLSWATEYGESRGSSRAVVIEEALRHFQALSRGGVPDLPARALDERRSALPKIVRARTLSAPDPVASARQAKLNRERS